MAIETTNPTTTVTDINDNVIDAGAVAADAITAAEIATNAIGAAEIAANAIGASELAIDAVEEINLSGMAIQSYPDTAAPATVSTGAVAFTYGGAWVQLIAASAIANDFYLSYLVIYSADPNYSACFELATGGAGAESAILEVAIIKGYNTPIIIPLEKKKIAANARVAIRACSEEAAINDYKVYLVVQK